MGKSQKKTGKGRLDKYYKLAKEQGYRARSAFKLIQLNKKYNFLESARCCIDLCAAPGGWLQVASKYMPVNSVIIGVDLVPIKPIPRVVTFASDITTPQCRNLIRAEVKDWKADVVLHDGAPNVGTAWIQDAYGQSELVLMSLKLAVEFLVKGGTFVTKVFRSADYNNLIWVFNQLFGKVEATKPPSSRNVSAEIFVVCREFLAPKFIDPKFLDPKHVFKDLSASIPDGSDKPARAHNAEANVFQPEKKRRKRDGYEDGNYTLFKSIPVSELIHSTDPISVLGSANKITFQTDEEKEWLKFEITSGDVKANCDDLKVLGKGDFKALIKWRLALREELGLDVKRKDTEDATETVEIIEEADEEQMIQDELERSNAENVARAKRDRRRANEIRNKTIQRMQLQMTAPMDIGLELQDASLGGQDDFFDLQGAEKGMRKRGGVSNLIGTEGVLSQESDVDNDSDNASDEEILDSEEEREKKTRGLENELDGMYDSYRSRLRERDAKYKVREGREKNKEREAWSGIKKNDSSDEEDSDAEGGGWEEMERAKGHNDNSSSSGDSDDEPEGPKTSTKKRSLPTTGSSRDSKRARLLTKLKEPIPSGSQASKVWFSQDIFAGISDDVKDIEHEVREEQDVEMVDVEDKTVDIEEENTDTDWDDDEDDFEVVPQVGEDVDMWDVANADEDALKQAHIKKHGLTTAEAVTLAQQLVNREKTKTQLINDGFNRYSLNAKDGLPSWFLDDETKHYKPNIPVTKEAIAALRAKQRALDARPIKKIAEAKARKKYKAAQKLEKAMKKAEGVNDTSDMSEREKASQIEKLMRKGLSKGKPKKEVKLVVAKGVHKGVKGRPKGVKGRYAMVDSRMKKEVRAKKRTEKANKKRKRA
ncbi:Spb1 C-terminal domain-containing protein [Lentinula edodes]|uniref:Spb1 C-terminal domain-containing protein n=1 Tax=Lentinula edodes TaxID=5353 RepID=UPI001E8D7017|nr:Spb1 C-terminal domain-containing protein [Lentinula edodes]KAH7880620.1 Spb1 C-terminal domain-containing protein [Lentinula edodes]KAJ3909764.1 Spb1 C-terminal domain-containing protein [Lentinula edodes]